MMIWLLAYSHRHGMDFSSYEDAAQARHGAAVLAVQEAPKECTAEIALQIQGHFNLGNDVEAVALYCEHVPGESFDIHPLEVVPSVGFSMLIAEVGTEVVHATRAWPRGNAASGAAWCGRLFWWASGPWTENRAPCFRAWIPKEPRHVTCIGCIVAEGVDGRPT